MKKKETVFVGLSGGVDSSVSAALLKQAGYSVVGVFIRTWQPDFIECTFREDRLDAMRVAAHLGIPFLECDAEEEYKKSVAEYMIEEYRRGCTPNPDILCNREIKFGVFWRFARERGADYVATGHYAQIRKVGEEFFLARGADPAKDQAYFLWTLESEDLSHTLFPIGHLKKTDVRKLAEKFGLPTAEKKDSQGVCMLGDLDIKEFLAHYIEEKRGNVLTEKGEAIGHHDGVAFLTLGERHGFTVTKKTSEDKRYYIVAKDVEKNTITVSNVQSTETSSGSASLAKTNFHIFDSNKGYTAEVRYHGAKVPCTLSHTEKDDTVQFSGPVLVAPGQSVVVYENDRVVGGGIVK